MDVLLDAFAIRLTDGYAAAAPTLARALELLLAIDLSDEDMPEVEEFAGRLFGAALAVQSLIVLGISIAAVAALQLFLNKTRTGRCMQATAQNPTVARLLGVPVERMILYTFLINAALVAVAPQYAHRPWSRAKIARRVRGTCARCGTRT